MYKNFLIRKAKNKWQAVDVEDGWDADWLDIYEYDSYSALIRRLDEMQ